MSDAETLRWYIGSNSLTLTRAVAAPQLIKFYHMLGLEGRKNPMETSVAMESSGGRFNLLKPSPCHALNTNHTCSKAARAHDSLTAVNLPGLRLCCSMVHTQTRTPEATYQCFYHYPVWRKHFEHQIPRRADANAQPGAPCAELATSLLPYLRQGTEWQ